MALKIVTIKTKVNSLKLLCVLKNQNPKVGRKGITMT